MLQLGGFIIAKVDGGMELVGGNKVGLGGLELVGSGIEVAGELWVVAAWGLCY